MKVVTMRSGREWQPEVQEEKKKKPREPSEEHLVSKSEEKQVESAIEARSQPSHEVPEYKTTIPYPARLKKDKTDEQYGRFLEIFKQLHINLLLVEVLSQMPRYAKFLKDLLSKKRKLEELSTVTLGGECSAVIQSKIPRKMRDPGSFIIPCLIGNLPKERALADLGASINLMPYQMFKKLGLGEPILTRMSLQLANRS